MVESYQPRERKTEHHGNSKQRQKALQSKQRLENKQNPSYTHAFPAEAWDDLILSAIVHVPCRWQEFILEVEGVVRRQRGYHQLSVDEPSVTLLLASNDASRPEFPQAF